MISKLVADMIAKRGLSLRQAAKEIGLNSHNTLMNILAGKDMDIETADLVCKWLGVPLSYAASGKDEQPPAIAMIAAVLKAAPELEKLFERAADEVTKGNLTLNDYEDILEYMVFKIEKGLSRKDLQQLKELDEEDIKNGE